MVVISDDGEWGGLHEAVKTAVDIAKMNASEMYVTYSPDGEYTSSDDIIATSA